MKVLTALSSTLLILLLFAGCKSKEAVMLKLKYEKDELLDYTISFKANCSARVHFNASYDYSFTADSMNKDSDYFLGARLAAIRTDINIPVFAGNDVVENYNSDKNYSDMDEGEMEAYAKYDSLMSKRYVVGYNSKGEIIQAFEVYGKVVVAPFSAGLLQVPFPDHKIKVGDTWKANIDNPLANCSTNLTPASSVFTYSVNDITPADVIINVDIDMQKLGSSGNESAGLKGSGIYKINPRNGHVDDGYIKVPLPGCDEALISIVPTPAKTE